MQAMATADPQAKWLMQAWLFYDNQEFWRPPQIQVCHPCPSALDLRIALACSAG